MEDTTGYKPHYRTLDDERLSADQMDEQRKRNIAYEYLCHLEEAKIWIQACINEDLPPTTELEEGLRNGVFLAKLGHFFAQSVVPIKRIYDKDQTRYHAKGLHFRHTDNINHWLRAMAEVGLPKIFYPETTDIYDKKNMPRAVYCVHALSLYLFKLGLAPQIQDLYGKINFTEEEISAMRKELDKYGIQMPAFSKIGGILANEMTVDDAALHAAIIAINEAIDQKVAADTFAALQNPAAALVNLQGVAIEEYQDMLFSAKQIKAENARNKMEHRKNAAVNLQSPSAVLIGSHEMSQISCGSINMTGVRLSLRRLSVSINGRDHAISSVSNPTPQPLKCRNLIFAFFGLRKSVGEWKMCTNCFVLSSVIHHSYRSAHSSLAVRLCCQLTSDLYGSISSIRKMDLQSHNGRITYFKTPMFCC